MTDFKYKPRIADSILQKKLKEPVFKMILTAVGNLAYKREDGIYVVPISSLRNWLGYGCLKDASILNDITIRKHWMENSINEGYMFETKKEPPIDY